MKHYLPAVLLVGLGLLLGVSDARAQDKPEPTPTNLIELLPEGGMAAAAMDFYLLMEVGAQGENQSMYMHWQIVPTEQGLSMRVGNGSAEEGGSSNNQVADYGPDGKLKSYLDRNSFGSDFSMEVTGTVEGDQLTLVTKTKQNIPGVEGGHAEDQHTVVDLKAFSDVVPTSWMPLAIGYHLRQENPSFQVRMADYGERYGTQIMTFEDIGTEMMDFRGEQTQVHVLIAKMSFEAAGAEGGEVEIALGQEQVMHLRCLPSGEIVEMKMSMQEQGFEMNMTARNVTEAEIRERFKDNAGGEGEPEVQEEAAE